MAKYHIYLPIMETDNETLRFPNFDELDNPNSTKYVKVAINMDSREAVVVKQMNPRSADNGLPLPISTEREINRSDIYIVYEVDVLGMDNKVQRGFLYVEKED